MLEDKDRGAYTISRLLRDFKGDRYYDDVAYNATAFQASPISKTPAAGFFALFERDKSYDNSLRSWFEDGMKELKQRNYGIIDASDLYDFAMSQMILWATRQDLVDAASDEAKDEFRRVFILAINPFRAELKNLNQLSFANLSKYPNLIGLGNYLSTEVMTHNDLDVDEIDRNRMKLFSSDTIRRNRLTLFTAAQYGRYPLGLLVAASRPGSPVSRVASQLVQIANDLNCALTLANDDRISQIRRVLGTSDGFTLKTSTNPPDDFAYETVFVHHFSDQFKMDMESRFSKWWDALKRERRDAVVRTVTQQARRPASYKPLPTKQRAKNRAWIERDYGKPIAIQKVRLNGSQAEIWEFNELVFAGFLNGHLIIIRNDRGTFTFLK